MSSHPSRDTEGSAKPFIVVPPQSVASAQLVALQLAAQLDLVLHYFDQMVAGQRKYASPEWHAELSEVYGDARRVLSEFDECCREDFEKRRG